VALGSMALHRNLMNEASPLKVREYLAYGIPTIIGYHDTDFPDGHPFILELPNEENNVESNLDKIRRFVSEVKGRRIERETIAHIDVKIKELQRFKFLTKFSLM
jgi:hypothetical protein